jgi:uncharacterized protein (TIGR03067 family)
VNALLAFKWPFSESTVERLGWMVIHSLWQFAIMALLAGLAARAMQRHSAATRYGVFVVAMSLSVVAVVTTWMRLPGDIPLPVARLVASDLSRYSTDAIDPAAGAARLSQVALLAGDAALDVPTPDFTPANATSKTPPAVLPPAPAIAQPGPTWSEFAESLIRPWMAWIVGAWGLGVVLCSARPLLGWRTLHRLRRVGISPASDEVLAAMHRVSGRLGMHRAVAVLQSTLTQVPVLVGYIKPVILLPVSLVTSISTAQLETILMHELSHVRRHDFLVNLLQTLVETLFFYHPAIWWLSRRIRIEREHCCDDYVVGLLGNGVEYGRALITIEELRGQSTVLALGANDGSLLARVRRIAGDDADSSSGRCTTALLVVTCLAAAGITLTSLFAQTAVQKRPIADTHVAGANPKPQQGGLSVEQKRLQGFWAVDSCESEAATLKAPNHDQRRWRWRVKGDEITWGRKGQQWKLNFKIDPTQTPKQIDFTFLNGPYNDMKCLGIYDWDGIEGKNLKILMQDPGANIGRPTSFERKAGSHTSQITLRPLPPVDPAKELASLQGTWCFDVLQFRVWPEPIGIGSDGMGRKSEKRWAVKGNRITWVGQDGERTYVTFTIDPFKTPKQIDFTFLNGPHHGEKCPGIYERPDERKDYLWLCMANPGANASRPIDVSYSSEGHQSMIGIYPVAPPDKPSLARRLARFQGVWKMTLCDSVLGTFGATQEEASKWKWTIKGDEILWNRQGDVWKLKLDVDPSKSPKEMDLTYLSGPYKGKKCLGMYKFGGVDRQSLMISIQDPGATVARPKSISMTSDSQTSLIFLRPSKPGDAEREIGSFHGSWTLKNIVTGGKNKAPGSWPLPRGKMPDKSGDGSEMRWVVKGHEITWTSPSGQETKASFTVDPRKRPKQIDLTFLSGPNKGTTCLGLYQRDDLDENILWLCMSDPGSKSARPKNFSYRYGEGRSLVSFYPFDPSGKQAPAASKPSAKPAPAPAETPGAIEPPAGAPAVP